MAKARSLLLVPAGASLLLGLDGALSRLALTPIIGVGAAAEAHGMVMVLGFLGTVIALERAVALRRGWAYAAPILLAGGMLVFLAGAPSLGRWLLIDGMAIFVGVYLALWRRQRDALTAIQALAAVMGLVAAICWFNFEIAQVLPLLVGFIVLTIASERLELARFQLPKNAPSVLIWFSAGLGVAATVSVTGAGLATRAFAVGLLALALWLLTNDVAVKTIRLTGQPRFSAAAMLTGYAWLIAASAVWVFAGSAYGHASYDFVVHATFLGFAMSMVLAHAPIILPAVIGRPLPYHWVFWAPLIALQLGLLVRFGGLLIGSNPTWQSGGVATVVALLLLPLAAISATMLRRTR